MPAEHARVKLARCAFGVYRSRMRIHRPVRVAFLLSQKESKLLIKLAKRAGVTISAWLRAQIRAEPEKENR
jgi:hypothetical protein